MVVVRGRYPSHRHGGPLPHQSPQTFSQRRHRGCHRRHGHGTADPRAAPPLAKSALIIRRLHLGYKGPRPPQAILEKKTNTARSKYKKRRYKTPTGHRAPRPQMLAAAPAACPLRLMYPTFSPSHNFLKHYCFSFLRLELTVQAAYICVNESYNFNYFPLLQRPRSPFTPPSVECQLSSLRILE